jgi:hypothetical protein
MRSAAWGALFLSWIGEMQAQPGGGEEVGDLADPFVERWVVARREGLLIRPDCRHKSRNVALE